MKPVPLVLALLLPLPAVAQVVAQHPWARATAPQQTVGGGYVTLTSPVDDRLVGVATPAAGHAEVHEMTMDGSVMRMRALPGGLPLPAGTPVVLAPGGYHLMLMELKAPLVAGQSISVELRFLHAAPLVVQLQVGSVGAAGPGS